MPVKRKNSKKNNASEKKSVIIRELAVMLERIRMLEAKVEELRNEGQNR